VTTIEQMLTAAEADPYSDFWDQLFEQARHIGTSDDDQALLLQRLPEIAGRYSPGEQDGVLFLAGQLAADLDEARWPRFREELATLRFLAGGWLASPASPQDFLYRLQAMTALEGDELWGAELSRIVDDEIEVECPRCGTLLFVAFGDGGHFATHEDYATKTIVEQTPLLPASPADLDGAGQRLYQASVQHGQTAIATALTYLFGQATCTQCSTEFRVSDQVSRY
jgi:hypothetical protein